MRSYLTRSRDEYYLEQFSSGATDGHIVQRLLSLLGRGEDPEEAGEARLIIVPGQVELRGLQLSGLRLSHLKQNNHMKVKMVSAELIDCI